MAQIRISREALTEVQRALEQYREEVSAAPLERSTQNTYLHHAETFVRWMNGTFEPGVLKKR